MGFSWRLRHFAYNVFLKRAIDGTVSFRNVLNFGENICFALTTQPQQGSVPAALDSCFIINMALTSDALKKE